MFNSTQLIIKTLIQTLQTEYRHLYGNRHPEYLETLRWVATVALENISNSNTLYHNVEHTVIVTLVGQQILYGKHLREGNVTCQDWLHTIISLLCHDIGYVKGICHQDRVPERLFDTGTSKMIQLSPSATDASLAPYHVDRGKCFVQEYFADHPIIDFKTIQHNLEMTRFPVPNDAEHQDTGDFPGLVRAADLIGQLSDPHYLDKLPALFYEFAEIGMNQVLGYSHPGDLRAAFPHFFWNVVYPYIQDGLHYLEVSEASQQIIAHLRANVFVVEYELFFNQIKVPVDTETVLMDEWWKNRTHPSKISLVNV
jgi:hypothetical protein